MKILATYNIKGGVGKTATAVNLAHAASMAGYNTLVWDLDPQGAASFYFRIKPRVKGTKKLMAGKKDIGQLIKGTDFENLDLLPADFSYRYLDILLDGEKKPTRRIRKILSPLEKEYDVVIMDCPPSISLASEAVFFASDALILPMIPTILSMRTFDMMLEYRKKSGMEKEMDILPFFSMVDRRKKLHQEILHDLPLRRGGFLHAYIPYASEVEKMGITRQPLGASHPNGTLARMYADLWQEILQRVNLFHL